MNPDDENDVKAADRSMQFILGLWAHPIFRNGDWPEAIKQQVQVKNMRYLSLNHPDNSKDDKGNFQNDNWFNYNISVETRLPPFSEDEKKLIARTSDFLGVNSYTTKFVEHAVNDPPEQLDGNVRFGLTYDNDMDLHGISPDQVDSSIKQKFPGWLWSIQNNSMIDTFLPN